MGARSPRDLPYLDLPLGRMWLDDATRPRDAYRFAVNIRDGEVRSGLTVRRVSMQAIRDAMNEAGQWLTPSRA